jgi:tRNA(Ile)-lysidine synthase TilS/MesJ
MRGCDLLNLSGMRSVAVVDGVAVWRPLLRFDKADIIAFAHAHAVPYFK